MENKEYIERAKELSQHIRDNVDIYQRVYGEDCFAVGIESGIVLGRDANTSDLERRIRRRFPGVDFFITNVKEAVNPQIGEMLSPE